MKLLQHRLVIILCVCASSPMYMFPRIARAWSVYFCWRVYSANDIGFLTDDDLVRGIFYDPMMKHMLWKAPSIIKNKSQCGLKKVSLSVHTSDLDSIVHVFFTKKPLWKPFLVLKQGSNFIINDMLMTHEMCPFSVALMPTGFISVIILVH